MGFLDKAKEAAEQAAASEEGVEDVQTKRELGQTYTELGKTAFELTESGEISHPRLEALAEKIRALNEPAAAEKQPGSNVVVRSAGDQRARAQQAGMQGPPDSHVAQAARPIAEHLHRGSRQAPFSLVPLRFFFHSGEAGVVVGKLLQMRKRDFPGHHRVTVGDVRQEIVETVFQLHAHPHPKLLDVERS